MQNDVCDIVMYNLLIIGFKLWYIILYKYNNTITIQFFVGTWYITYKRIQILF